MKLADELKQLQADVPADPPTSCGDTVETELGQPIEELFAEFDDMPMASASIGQVHCARLKTGERVVVKVQHSDIENTVREDLDVLAGLALLAERVPELASYHPASTVAEMGRVLRRELDFGREERNLQLFCSRYKDDPHGAHSAAVHGILHGPRADDGADRGDQAGSRSGCWPKASTWTRSRGGEPSCTWT